MARSTKPNGLSCEVCGNPLTGKQRRACSSECRNKLGGQERSNRAALARTVAENAVAEAVQEEVNQQVGPIVQEVLTETVLQQIGKAVTLLPAAFAVLEKNLRSNDEEVAQKAAKELLRWTLGNPSVAPKQADEDQKPLLVRFEIPGGELPPHNPVALERGADEIELEDEDPELNPDLRECVECHRYKTDDQFVGRSPRCKECHDRITGSIQDRYGKFDLG